MDPIQSPTWLRQPLSDHEQGTPVGEEPPPLFFVRGALDETVEFIRRKIGLPQEGEQKQEEPELTEEQVKKARDELKWMRHILIYHFKETIDHPSSNNDEPLQPGLVEALEYLWLDAYVANPESVLMVLEDAKGLSGFALAIPSVVQHADFIENKFLPHVWDTVAEYLKHETAITIAELIDSMYYSASDDVDPLLREEFPGYLQVVFEPSPPAVTNTRAAEEGQSVRLLEAGLSRLEKRTGVSKLHATIAANDTISYQTFVGDKFCELWRDESGYVVLGRRTPTGGRASRAKSNAEVIPFQTGVMEGFYNRPWTKENRLSLIEMMGQWSMKYYMYAPKDDIKHRASWREPYTESELEELKEYVLCCQKNSVSLIYAVAPGLDISYSSYNDRKLLKEKIDQVAGIGVKHFAILFDDIPANLNEEDEEIFGSAAVAQASVTNMLVCDYWRKLYSETHSLKAIPHMTFFFCPTEYCDVMAKPDIFSSGYLRALGSTLLLEVEIFWTGPLVVSPHVYRADLRTIAHLVRRPVVLWDNLHANDYDSGNRLYLGPFAGRDPKIYQSCRAIISNPNCSFAANYIPLRSLSLYAQYIDSGEFDSESPDALTDRIFSRTIDEWYEYLQDDLPQQHSEVNMGGIGEVSIDKDDIDKLISLNQHGVFTKQDLTLLTHQFCLPFCLGATARVILVYIQSALLLTDFDGRVTGTPVLSEADQKAVIPIVEILFEKCGFRLPRKQVDPLEVVDTALELCSICSQLHEKLCALKVRELVYTLSPYVSATSARMSVVKSYIDFARGKQEELEEDNRHDREKSARWKKLLHATEVMESKVHFPQTCKLDGFVSDSATKTAAHLYHQPEPSNPVLKHMFFMAGPVNGGFSAALASMIDLDLCRNGFAAKEFNPGPFFWYLQNGHQITPTDSSSGQSGKK